MAETSHTEGLSEDEAQDKSKMRRREGGCTMMPDRCHLQTVRQHSKAAVTKNNPQGQLYREGKTCPREKLNG